MKSLLYADDLVIYTENRNSNEAVQILQDNIDKINNWCDETGFQFNENKAGPYISEEEQKLG